MEEELQEHERDLQVFQHAYDSIRKRVQEVDDERRLMKLGIWSGTSAVMGSLELSIHHLERVVSELSDILQRIDHGIILDLDKE